MNLIGNSCIASYITRDLLKEKFKNPFCWCIMDFESCYNLVKFWDELNFKNYKLIKDKNWNFSIIIDEKVKIQYVHYIFDKNAKEIIKKSPDVRYCKIWEYIIEKYEKRIQDIKKEQPVFLFATANNGLSRHKQFSIDEQKKLLDLNSKYKIILSFKNNIIDNRAFIVNQTKNFNDNDIKISTFIYNNCEVFHE